MSKYNEYAKRLDETARRLFGAHNEAQAAYNAAKRAHDVHPYANHTSGVIPGESAVTLARLKADMEMAKADLVKASADLAAGKGQIRQIQTELASQLEADTAADPKALDMPTIELLKSGILQPHEYAKLMDDNKHNPTMARLIGSYAEKAFENAKDPAARGAIMRAIDGSKKAGGGEYAAAFDGLCAIFDRCVNNPPLFSHWDELTGAMVENF